MSGNSGPGNRRVWSAAAPAPGRRRRSPQAWLGIAAAVAAIIAVPAAVLPVIDWFEQRQSGLEVIAVGLDQPALIDAVETGPGLTSGSDRIVSRPVRIDAAVVDLTIVNRSEDVRVLTRLGVTVTGMVETTGCASGGGGPIGVSAVYPLELPEQGGSAERPVVFELAPKKTDRLALTLGPAADDGLRGVYRLDVYAIDDDGDRVDLGTVAIAAPPALSTLYSGDVTLLPLREIPRLDCVRQLRKDLEAALDGAPHVARQARELLDRIRAAERRLAERDPR